MIKVNNKRRGEAGEYIGRGSPLGNPFVIGKDGTREEVVDKYRTWIFNKLENNKRPIVEEIGRLYELWQKQGELKLLCWCSPELCHGNIIKMILEDINMIHIKYNGDPIMAAIKEPYV